MIGFRLGMVFMYKLLVVAFLLSCSGQESRDRQNPGIFLGQKRFTTNSNELWLARAISLANCVSDQSDFIDEIKKTNRFSFTNDTSMAVAEKIGSGIGIEVELYSSILPKCTRWIPDWMCSNVNAYHDPKTGKIYLNTRNNPRQFIDMVDTLVHERAHIWYSHNGNFKTKENLESVPYKVGEISRKYVEKCL